MGESLGAGLGGEGDIRAGDINLTEVFCYCFLTEIQNAKYKTEKQVQIVE
jgi:hypothetical protein